MLMTNAWVNAVSIGIVAASMWQVWRVTRARRTREAAKKPAASQLPLAHAGGNQAEIATSEMCGCLHCGRVFRPAEIAGWVEQTAYCPHCGRAAVTGLGSKITPMPELGRLDRANMQNGPAHDRTGSGKASNE